MTTLVFDELSSSQESENFYIDVLTQHGKSTSAKLIESIKMTVDRGVDFRLLGGALLLFPYLTDVTIEQNYSPKACTLDHLVMFIDALKLEKFKLIDLQSEFLEGIEPPNLFTKLPCNCVYYINYGFSDGQGGDIGSLTTHMSPTNNKFMVYTKYA